MRFFLLFLLFLSLLGCSSSTPIKSSQYQANYLDAKYLQTLDFGEKDLIVTLIANQWYYVQKDGKSMLVITNDSGEADVFKEGLARTRVNGKIGFFNRNLDIVIEPFYDFAFPFHDGVAEICVGCTEVQSGGQSMLDGGSWKRINRSGLILEE